jgi:HEAT repeat protein
MVRGEALVAAVSQSRSTKPETLLAALNDPDGDVRAVATRGLGFRGNELALQPLIELLKDDNQLVRASAALALGDIGDRRATEPLIKGLEDSDEQVRLISGLSLCRLRDPRAVGPLITHLGKDRKFDLHPYMTGQKTQSWAAWWEKNKDTWPPAAKAEQGPKEQR